MSDGGEQDEPEEEQRPARPAASEGVRILGAEEARAALEGGQVARRIGDDKLRFGDVPARPDPAVRPAGRFPRPTAPEDGDPGAPGAEREDDHEGDMVAEIVEGDEEAGSDERAFRDELAGIADEGPADEAPAGGGGTDASGPIDLPHWTEPPTGEIPIILADSDVTDGPKSGGNAPKGGASGTSAPRFRSKVGDWAESDFAEAELFGEADDAFKALEDVGDDDDDDAEFAASVARRRRLRPRRTTPVDGDGDGDGDGSTPGGGRVRSASSRPTKTSTGGHGPGSSSGPPAAEAPRSDLTTRVIVGVAVAVAALICLTLGRGATALLAAAIVGLATFEFYEGIRKRGFHPATILGLLAAVTTPLAAYKVGEAAFPLMVALLTVFTMLWFLVRVVDARPLVGIAVTLFGYLYIGGLGGFAGLLLAFPNGVGFILGVALCAVAYDVAGYVVGSQFGKTPLAIMISPNKTVEGLAGGMVASIVVAAVVVNRITPWNDLMHALALGVIVAIVAPLGDLCASMIKRDLQLKDFGTLLPGHGGVLDRFDAILFCLPAVYYLARFLKIG